MQPEAPSSDALRASIARTIARVERRAAAIEGDLERAARAEAEAERARIFVADAARTPRGAARLAAVDWSSGVAERVEMPLDPARGAKEQVDAVFRRARRLKGGAAIARGRLDEARAALRDLASIAALVAAPDADLAALEARARSAAPRDFRPPPPAGPVAAAKARRAEPPEARAYRTFASAAGTPILVGRGAARNDALTFRVARLHDLWLHAKGHAGAHVVVRLVKGASCPAEVLVDAAHLAAHFSDARDEAAVEVTYAQRRFVRKPRGSAPGAVVVDREKVIFLRRQEAVLRRLLASERPG